MEWGVWGGPVRIVGTHYVMQKTRFAIKPGPVKVIFHPPIAPKDFVSRECLMEKVGAAIESGLLHDYQKSTTKEHEGNLMAWRFPSWFCSVWSYSFDLFLLAAFAISCSLGSN